jgi:dolichol-phosphate mannosyltransferase
MLEKWETGAKIVYGRRISRKDGFLKKLTARWYYKILYRASDIKIMGNIADFRLIDRVVADKLRQMKERTRYLRGLVPWLGYKYEVVDYERPKRKHGETGFSMLKMIRFAMAGILNFSLLPLMLGLIIGVFIIFSGFVFLIYLAIRYFFDGQFYKLLEWLAVVNYILIGFLFILLWILGEYIGKIYDETKGRPLYIVDETMNLEGK